MIPARGGSKRLERKNVSDISGKPLIAYTIEAAVESDIFDRVIVSTEDDEIASVADEHGADIPFTRPMELASDTAQVVDVTDHTLNFFDEQGVEFDRLAVLLPTTPLRTADDLVNAYERFDSHPDAEFLMCVTDYQFSPFEALHEVDDGMLEKYWDHEYLEMRSQERPDLVVDNGSAYIMDVEAYERERTFYGSSLIGYYMPPERSIDVDEKFDLDLAEFLLQR
jgi:CMP-N-acetylneuraminic acid synthetase